MNASFWYFAPLSGIVGIAFESGVEDKQRGGHEGGTGGGQGVTGDEDLDDKVGTVVEGRVACEAGTTDGRSAAP